MSARPKSAIALRWGKKMAELDGYIFVTAEYNLCGEQMSSRSSVNRQCIRSPFAPDRSIPPTLRPLMRWFVLRLFPDLFFRPDNLIEAIAVVGLEAFFASGHSFVARRQ